MAEHKLKGDWESRKVWLDGVELSPGRSQKIYNHSPDGFNWGYGGSGPSQLALAICLELMGDEGEFYYQRFKWNFIATLPQADFDVTFNLEEIIKKEDT